MLILIVANGYPTQKYPLNGIFEFDQARALADAGHKVLFIAVDLRSLRRCRKWGIEHFYQDGVEVYAFNVPMGRVPHSILRCVGQWGLRMVYNRVQKEHGTPDIVHAHFLNMAEIALTLKPMLKATKFVMTEHWSLLNGEYFTFPLWVKNYAHHIYCQYDKVICVSSMLANNIRTFFKIKDIIVIPNMIDPLFLSGTPVMHEHFEFVFVGGIDVRKSPLECIQAFYNAFQMNNFKTIYGKTIRLHLVGSGSLFNDCLERIKELKLEKNIYMMGQMTRDKIKDMLCSSDCFVLPSKLETFGVVYIEAMACGLPVIATKCGGPESFVNENNGVLIQPGDIQALCAAFKYITSNIEKYNKKEIMKFVNTHFSPTVIASQILEVYSGII